jgi:hypothetical protein
MFSVTLIYTYNDYYTNSTLYTWAILNQHANKMTVIEWRHLATTGGIRSPLVSFPVQHNDSSVVQTFFRKINTLLLSHVWFELRINVTIKVGAARSTNCEWLSNAHTSHGNAVNLTNK